MQKKMMCSICVMVLFWFSSLALANDLNSLFDLVETLKLERHGYVLGAALNQEQMETAASNPIDASALDTFKFKDKKLYVVAQKTSNRVLIIYERFEDATQQEIQNLVGDMYMNFDDPTGLAHDKVVYWFYTKKGILTSQEKDAAQQNKQKLEILATVKLFSDINIMEKIKESEPATGPVYYIISSDPILKLFKDT